MPLEMAPKQLQLQKCRVLELYCGTSLAAVGWDWSYTSVLVLLSGLGWGN